MTFFVKFCCKYDCIFFSFIVIFFYQLITFVVGHIDVMAPVGLSSCDSHQAYAIQSSLRSVRM